MFTNKPAGSLIRPYLVWPSPKSRHHVCANIDRRGQMRTHRGKASRAKARSPSARNTVENKPRRAIPQVFASKALLQMPRRVQWRCDGLCLAPGCLLVPADTASQTKTIPLWKRFSHFFLKTRDSSSPHHATGGQSGQANRQADKGRGDFPRRRSWFRGDLIDGRERVEAL